MPAAQVDHAVQLAALFVVLCIPLPHGAQVRFVVDEPLDVTYSPGVHVVFATQAVTGLLS